MERMENSEQERQSRREWHLIEKVVMTHSEELKKSRRWGIVFKSLTFAYLFVILFFVFQNAMPRSDKQVSTGGHTAVVQLKGAIADGSDASYAQLRRPLRQAFAHPDTLAVVLEVNSPGGSPVQSQMIYDLVLELRAEYPDIPLYAVIGEIGASGAYFVAAAADEIYASGSSLVGSIGVVSGGFGFHEAMERLGIERRLYTAGTNKGFLDSFSPERDEEVAHWETVLSDVHQQFIDAVVSGRGDRLVDDERIFNGYMWSGAQSQSLGLVDGLATVHSLAEQIEAPELLYFDPPKDPLRKLLEDFGVSVGQGIAARVMSMDGDALRLK
ncbi:S49 family peptidase [Salinispirillum sp. LH 10-3-1]|uniref:S49 family peptidase n=1 Tax=Salinispirillum sp. LH 10-3-1 TaxID=2952525 RepID=A0AB38YBC6_9GAMM